jgi:hypothetical protein
MPGAAPLAISAKTARGRLEMRIKRTVLIKFMGTTGAQIALVIRVSVADESFQGRSG